MLSQLRALNIELQMDDFGFELFILELSAPYQSIH